MIRRPQDSSDSERSDSEDEESADCDDEDSHGMSWLSSFDSLIAAHRTRRRTAFMSLQAPAVRRGD